MVSVNNWENLSKALKFYEDLDYEYINVPWLVSEDSTFATCQKKIEPNYKDLYLVGSGEQSFIEIAKDLNLKKYMTLTPCFRFEEGLIDKFHQDYFMKVELFWKLSKIEDVNSCKEKLDLVLNDAYSFYSKYSSVEKVFLGDQYDLNINGIEVGSYGIRHHKNFTWIFGTGCAEPRLSLALKEES